MDKKKILIVDDEPDVLFILEKELVARDYSVIKAENGNDAIILAKSKQPDLIILDVMMPVPDGTEVAARLKEDPETRGIPIIFLSCLFSKNKEKEKRHIVDGNIFFAKPYDMKELLPEMKKLLQDKVSEEQIGKGFSNG